MLKVHIAFICYEEVHTSTQGEMPFAFDSTGWLVKSEQVGEKKKAMSIYISSEFAITFKQ